MLCPVTELLCGGRIPAIYFELEGHSLTNRFFLRTATWSRSAAPPGTLPLDTLFEEADSEFILAVKQTARAEEQNEEGGGGMGCRIRQPLPQSRSRYTELTGKTLKCGTRVEPATK